MFINSLEAILFDFDGTLARTEDVKLDALKSFMTNKGVEEFKREPGDSSSQIIRDTFAHSHSVEEREVLAKEFGAYQAEFMDSSIEAEEVLYEDTMRMLSQVHDHGVKKTIVTTSNRLVIRAMGNKSGILEMFEEEIVVTKDDVPAGKEKPNPDPYLLACERLGVNPEKCLAIEDSSTGINSALNAGCHVVILNREDKDFSRFQGQAILEATDLDEIWEFLQHQSA